jgi:hypothetical protein
MNKNEFIEMMKRTQAPLVKMVEMIPDDKLDWAPADGLMCMDHLIKHLSENWCIIKMMVNNEWPPMDPEKIEEMMKLENLPRCSKQEALEAMEKDMNDAATFIENDISDEDFDSKVVSAPWGFQGEIWKACLMARDHALHHKMQLHIYLKILGLPVNTMTLYGM